MPVKWDAKDSSWSCCRTNNQFCVRFLPSKLPNTGKATQIRKMGLFGVVGINLCHQKWHHSIITY